MKKLKVLHVLNTGKYSGAEKVVINICNSLNDRIDFIYTSPDGPIREILEENQICYIPMTNKSVNRKELHNIIRAEKPDIVHTHDFTAGVQASFSFSNIPLINHIHNNSLWIKRICLKSIIYAFSCRRYKTILTVSNSIMDEYVFGHFFRKKVLNIGNPVDITSILAKAEEPGEIPKYDIIFVGRLSEAKNPGFFLDIVSEIYRIIPNIKVAMIGDGELRDSVDLIIEKLHLQKVVDRYGFQNNPYKYIKNAKMMCIPSKWEGFGLAAVESMALGKPVIASRVGGLKELINEECGYLCESKKEYVDAIIQLLTDGTVYSNKSYGAEERAQKLNNIGDYTRKLESIYNELV